MADKKTDCIRLRRQFDTGPIRQTYVKLSKNDPLNAEAIAKAATLPTMRFVPVKRHEQLDMQVLHRVRAQFVRQRTARVSQFRSFLLEYGIAIHTGIGMLQHDATRVLADDSNDLTTTIQRLPRPDRPASTRVRSALR
ncbi:IS110 family transposase [Burkholderia vietnamiensis]|uniref:IS110 family transposase n=1 Tax=Burkholderia vietnamiensis TaxID=60552 RepID=UPI001CF2AC1B|nr:transposase [Burkholderia vietnamiensis]MCA8197498.1 transposase [Burkholderia vietnamiensis]MDN8037531.1 transposase [Burkholderia vietnamiensis]